MILKSVCTWALLLVSLNVTAGGGGPIDFTPHGTQPGLQFSLEPPTNCSSCHKGGDLVDDIRNMPHGSWIGSMKANASRDPLFWAALDVANNDIPGIGDFCLRCHTPDGWYKGRVVKSTDGSPADPSGANGCNLSGDYVTTGIDTNDYSGVNCHVCHRMDKNGPNGEAHFSQNGDMWLNDENCEGGFGPCRKGPYGPQDYMDGGSTPPHAWEESAFIQSSEFCGTCHDISSPEIEQDGVVSIAQLFWHEGVQTNVAMPIERTYTEWKRSEFGDLIFRDAIEVITSTELPILNTGQSCQDCHMPNTTSLEARACFFDPGGRRTNNLQTHQFAGANTWIPQVIKAIYGDALEANDTGPGRKESLDLTTAYALGMLQNQSATLETNVVSQTPNQLDVNVKVTNLTGHKLPTSYAEGRRMWIHVEATDGSNTTFWESGAYNAATGVLTEDAQIKIYEALQGIWSTSKNECEVTDSEGNKMFHFVLNNCIAKDNRIPPLGFTGADDMELEPVGISYPPRPGHAGQVVNYDETVYQVPITGVTGPITVTATLKYQVASKDYIDFLADQAVDNNFQSENDMCNRTWTVGPADQTRGAFMKSLWETYGRAAPVDMVSDDVEVEVMP